jgi:hypothetical protein
MESALPGALFYFGRHYWRLAVFSKAGGFRCLRHPGSSCRGGGSPLRGRLYKKVVFAALRGRWGKTVFPKVDAASPRGLMEPPGLTPLGTKGSVRDRLPPPGLFEGSAQGSYKASLPLGRYGAFGANIKCREAAYILIARRAIPQPSAQRAVKPKNPPAHWAGQT